MKVGIVISQYILYLIMGVLPLTSEFKLEIKYYYF